MSDNTMAYQLHDVDCVRGTATVLEGVSLDVNRGEILALVGPNGAGKSTLLAVMAGGIGPSPGRGVLQGKDIATFSPRELARLRSVLLQSNQVSFSFSVRDVVLMGRSPWAATSDDETDERVVRRAMADADVEHLANRSFQALSGGERARASLARVFAQDTEVVLLDEPTASLDLRHQEDVMVAARRLADEGKAVVVVLHDLSLAAAWADQIAILAGGRLVEVGVPADTINADLVKRVYGIDVHVLSDPSGRMVIVPQRP